MATLTFNIEEIFNQVYGYKPFKVTDFPSESAQESPYQVKRIADKRTTFKGSNIYGGQDLIGREVFLPVTIQAGGKNYEFPYSVLSMRRSKIIEETHMVERGGSVKELIGLKDWQISMKGFLIDPYNQFPDEQLFLLKELFEYKVPVRLKCALSDLFLNDDDYVVITDLDIPDKAKVIGVRDFSMGMVSDSILTLTVD